MYDKKDYEELEIEKAKLEIKEINRKLIYHCSVAFACAFPFLLFFIFLISEIFNFLIQVIK